VSGRPQGDTRTLSHDERVATWGKSSGNPKTLTVRQLERHQGIARGGSKCSWKTKSNSAARRLQCSENSTKNWRRTFPKKTPQNKKNSLGLWGGATCGKLLHSPERNNCAAAGGTSCQNCEGRTDKRVFRGERLGKTSAGSDGGGEGTSSSLGMFSLPSGNTKSSDVGGRRNGGARSSGVIKKKTNQNKKAPFELQGDTRE